MNISRRLGLLSVPGYCIKMPQFDLAHPNQAEYRLRNLPNIDRSCCVYFAIKTDDDNWTRILRNNLRADFQIELYNSLGRALVKFHGKLSDFTAYSSTRMDFIALYPLHQRISFSPQTYEEYMLKYSYNPSIDLEGYNGFIYLECGGNK